MDEWLVATWPVVSVLIVLAMLGSCNRASAEYVPYGGGCVTTVVIQPDGKRLICTTCPTGNGLAVTICQ